MKKTRYEVEYEVREVAKTIQDQYDLNNDYYGDCYPLEVMQLENKMEHLTNDCDYQSVLNEVKNIFESYAMSRLEEM